MSSSASLSASLAPQFATATNNSSAAPPQKPVVNNQKLIEEHLRSLKQLHEKEKHLPIDELARQVFAEFDRSNSGYITFQDLAAILLERTAADHKQATTDLEIELVVESRADVQKMLRILDPKGTGKIDFSDFYRAFTFFEFFRLGYKKGFEVLDDWSISNHVQPFPFHSILSKGSYTCFDCCSQSCSVENCPFCSNIHSCLEHSEPFVLLHLRGLAFPFIHTGGAAMRERH